MTQVEARTTNKKAGKQLHGRNACSGESKSRSGETDTGSTPALNAQAASTQVEVSELSLVTHHQGLMRLNRWVQEHGAFRMTLKQAARIACLEPHYFSATFREHVGKTFKEWRSRYRVIWAVQAIRLSQHSINEIVQRAGYRNRRALEKGVKRQTGMTPGRIRDQFRSYGSGRDVPDA